MLTMCGCQRARLRRLPTGLVVSVLNSPPPSSELPSALKAMMDALHSTHTNQIKGYLDQTAYDLHMLTAQQFQVRYRPLWAAHAPPCARPSDQAARYRSGGAWRPPRIAVQTGLVDVLQHVLQSFKTLGKDAQLGLRTAVEVCTGALPSSARAFGQRQQARVPPMARQFSVFFWATRF